LSVHLQASLTGDLDEDEMELLHSEAEQNRRKRIESIVNLQQERNGLIEPKKDLAIQPGMYVSLPPTMPETAEEENADHSKDTATSTSETEQRGLANNTSSNKPKNSSYRRRNRANASRRQPHGQPPRQQWQRKEADTSHQ
jgi:E3 ubiquitin-protein ligase RNF25